jgi:crotonobetainyl-CoA:carnitine CoA-transferase CaiB-like acyl-CoA transferase
VLDLGLALSGPTCGRILAEFGADVVKIASPGKGVAGYLNRGKRSLLLDLRAASGQEVFWRLADQADVVLENFSPGTASRLGIGWDEVRARRPEAVYTSISAYGLGGPWEGRRGWERQGQAVTGIMERTGLPSVLGPYNLVDIGAGILAAFATALALYDRQATGRGQRASTSLAQAATYHQAAFMVSFPGHQPSEPRGYDALGTSPLQRYYRAADRWLFLAARPADVPALAALAGWPGVPGPARPQATVPAAGATVPDGLEKDLEVAFAAAAADDLTARLAAAGVAAHPVSSLADVMADPVNRARGLSVTQDVPGTGPCTMPGVPARLSATPARPGHPPRAPGADAGEILAGAGLGDRLAALERAWVIRATDLPAAWP